MQKFIWSLLNLDKLSFFKYILLYKTLETKTRRRLNRLHPLIEPSLIKQFQDTPLWINKKINRREYFSLINDLHLELKQNLTKYKLLNIEKKNTIPRLYAKFSYNNTLYTLVDEDSKVIATSSAGALGFKGNKRSTSFAAEVSIKPILNIIHNFKSKQIELYLLGIGDGRKVIFKSLKSINIKTVVDFTSIPHNGCRPSKRRRL